VGHVRLLRRCHELAGPGGHVAVAVNTDDFVESFKGKRPVIPAQERINVVAACRYVDDVWLNIGGDKQAELIIGTLPDIIAVGDDWKDRDYPGQLGITQGWLDTRGIRVVYLPRTPGVSSSSIRAAL
jgi:glycerol-3-phosphate cytidylyltransferase